MNHPNVFPHKKYNGKYVFATLHHPDSQDPATIEIWMQRYGPKGSKPPIKVVFYVYDYTKPRAHKPPYYGLCSRRPIHSFEYALTVAEECKSNAEKNGWIEAASEAPLQVAS